MRRKRALSGPAEDVGKIALVQRRLQLLDGDFPDVEVRIHGRGHGAEWRAGPLARYALGGRDGGGPAKRDGAAQCEEGGERRWASGSRV